MALDARTLIVVTAVAALVGALSLVWTIAVRRERGAGIWAVSLLFTALATSMLVARDVVSSPPLIALRTALFGLSYGLRYVALALFFGVPWSGAVAWGPAALQVGLVLALTSSPLTGIALVDLTRFAQNALLVAIVLRHGSPRTSRAQGLMVIGLVVTASIFLFRGVPGILDPGAFRSISASSPVQSATWLASFIGTIVCSFALVLMYEDRSAGAVARRKAELEATLARTKRLEGFLSICMHCKKVNAQAGAWQQVEKYVSDNSDARFSHGICPDCLQEYYPEVEGQ